MRAGMSSSAVAEWVPLRRWARDHGVIGQMHCYVHQVAIIDKADMQEQKKKALQWNLHSNDHLRPATPALEAPTNSLPISHIPIEIARRTWEGGFSSRPFANCRCCPRRRVGHVAVARSPRCSS